jgi:hypothetical protein
MRNEQRASTGRSAPHHEAASSAWVLTGAHANAVLDAALEDDVCTCGMSAIQAASHHRVDYPYRLLIEAAEMLAGFASQVPAAPGSPRSGCPSRDACPSGLAAIGQAILDRSPGPAEAHGVHMPLATLALTLIGRCRFALQIQRQNIVRNDADGSPMDLEIAALDDIEVACHAETTGQPVAPARWKGHASLPAMVSAHLAAWRVALELSRFAVSSQSEGPDFMLSTDRALEAVSELRALCATALQELSEGASQNAAEF